MEEKEEIVSFKAISDRMVYGVLTPDGNKMMASISGYDLSVAFNMGNIHSLADAEACANAMVDVMYQSWMDRLLADRPDFIKQTPT